MGFSPGRSGTGTPRRSRSSLKPICNNFKKVYFLPMIGSPSMNFSPTKEQPCSRD